MNTSRMPGTFPSEWRNRKEYKKELGSQVRRRWRRPFRHKTSDHLWCLTHEWALASAVIIFKRYASSPVNVGMRVIIRTHDHMGVLYFQVDAYSAGSYDIVASWRSHLDPQKLLWRSGAISQALRFQDLPALAHEHSGVWPLPEHIRQAVHMLWSQPATTIRRPYGER